MNEQIQEVLQRKGIDPATVIDAQVELSAEYMWKTKAEWPIGGTYTGSQRGYDDELVAQRVTTRATIDVVGRHPDGRQVAPIGPDDLERSRVEVVDVGQWVPVDQVSPTVPKVC